MFVTVHVLAGALLGQHVPRPASAFALGVASHIALDCVPHWGLPDEAGFLRVARVDGLVGLAAIGFALARTPAAQRHAAVAGIAGAVLLDLDKPTRHFFGVSPFPRTVDAFHQRIQQGRESPRRWPIEAATALALVAYLRRETAP